MKTLSSNIIEVEDSLEAANDWFCREKLSDGLPIVPPTAERVERMLDGTRRDPQEVIGSIPPKWAPATVEKIAINAVMAGCLPEYLPVVIAAVEAMCEPRFNLYGVQATTGYVGPALLVNGPIRKQLDINCDAGVFGPGYRANATIGRAYGLLSQNLQGGSLPGLTYMGSQGNNYSYNNVTFAENEERSPWEPFHVQHGFAPTDSAVSVFTGCRATAYTLGVRETYWREHVRNLLRGMDPHTPPTLLLDPITARQFIDRGGFTKKDALIDWIYENARMPAKEYWDYQLIQNYIYPRATFGEEPWATKLRAAPDEMITMYRREDIHVVVVGGETNPYWRMMGCTYGKTVPVDDWR